MNNKLIKKLSYVLIVTMLMMLLQVEGGAAEDAAGHVSVSSPSCEIDQNVTVTVTVSVTGDINMQGYTFDVQFDNTALEYVSCDCKDSSLPGNVIHAIDESATGKSLSIGFKFKSKKIGATSVSVKNVSIGSDTPVDGKPVRFKPGAVNGTVTVNPHPEASHDANLASLSVGEGKISPAFSPDVLNYTVSVAGTVSKATVSAKTADSKAKYVIGGNTGLKEGQNTVTVKVTAEDGTTTKTYTITVTRAKPPTPKPATPTPKPTEAVKVKIGEEELSLKGKPSDEYTSKTEEWEVTAIEYGKYKVGALKNKLTGVVVVELSDGNLYMFNTEDGTASRYCPMESPKQSFILMDVTDEVIIPMGYQKTTKTLNEIEIPAYVTSETSEYAIVYAKDDKGTIGWFEWDTVNNTFQRFNTEEVELVPTPTPTPTPVPTATPTPTVTPTPEPLPTIPEKSSTASSGSPLMNKILMGTSGVCFVLMVVFLVLFLVQKGRNGKRFSPDESYSDDDDYL